VGRIVGFADFCDFVAENSLDKLCVIRVELNIAGNHTLYYKHKVQGDYFLTSSVIILGNKKQANQGIPTEPDLFPMCLDWHL
jgi:hypothetical protein